MQKIARFEKVSIQRFMEDFKDCFSQREDPQEVYHQLKLPKRATMGSAGYDFYSPIAFTLEPNETIKLPTGIRASMQEGWVLQLYPRSSLGFKYRIQLNNTVGIIDKDYYDSDNEGHIFVKITNDSNEGKRVTIEAGEALIQGVFLPFGIVEDDEVTKLRNGGFGSTNT